MNKSSKWLLVAVVAAIILISLALATRPGEPKISNELIRISFPTAGAKISSTTPLVVTGEARGTWYFEASFPIDVANWDGLIIGQGHAEAQSDWMTTEFVPFKGTINFTKPDYGTRGAVIFRNDNPSGDPKNDKAVEVQIEFI